MGAKKTGAFYVTIVLGLLIFSPSQGAELKPMVLAFYYPWYRTQGFSGEWDHWNQEGADPDKIDAQGQRELTSAHYPRNGPYDSTDPEIIQRHLQESEQAGIDAWIVSWWGLDYQPGSVPAILDTIAKTNSPIKITLYYEMVPGCKGYPCLNLKPEQRIQAVLKDLEFIQKNFAAHPAFLRIENRPVLFIYTRAMLQASAQWPEISAQARGTENWFFSGDCTSIFTPALTGRGFDQIHFYDPVVELNLFSARLLRYSDFVRSAHSAGKSAALTVIPGYDERKIPSRKLQIHAERNSGKLYQTLWNKAIQAEPDWILITSFNEWHEGSEIEPSREFRDQYLDLTAEWSKKFKGPPGVGP